ncbi:MAG: sulfite exporter TauE/SafE family protein [Candidatus Rokubacteria bacterium]|nr:sulfite exporter TauE/SafE family protein [Candidatus Rokubacteria bacterium]
MRLLFLLGVTVAGFVAQLVDGSLGMGYGVTSTSLLLALGLTPAIASASVHVAEIGTSLASGASHWRYGNVDTGVLLRLAVPGAVGAFAGAVVLSNLSLAHARPWVSVVLLVLGAVIVWRCVRARRAALRISASRRAWLLAPLGLIGGFLDASGGGGWGPVTTSTLTATGRLAARRAIGTVSASEFVVALAASAGFLFALGESAIHWDVAVLILIGGVIAAPIAAAIVQRFDEKALGTAIGATIVLLNADRGGGLLGADPQVVVAIRIATLLAGGGIVAVVLIRGRSERRAAAEAPAATG